MTRCLRSAEMLKILQQKGGKKIDEASATKILKIIKFTYMREHHSILCLTSLITKEILTSH